MQFGIKMCLTSKLHINSRMLKKESVVFEPNYIFSTTKSLKIRKIAMVLILKVLVQEVLKTSLIKNSCIEYLMFKK